MNIEIKHLEGPNGPIELPTVVYYINPVQGVLVAGWNGPDNALRLDDGLGGGVANWLLLGRLSEAPFPIAPITRNSLEIGGWDFLTYPNPLVAIGTYIGDEPPPMPDDALLKIIADTVQQGARERELERSGDPGLMSEMAELIGKHAPVNEQPGSFKFEAFRQTIDYLRNTPMMAHLDPGTVLLGSTMAAYINDDLEEADLLELVETDRERTLAYGLIASVWERHYGEKSAKLDHTSHDVAIELFASGITKQADFNAFLENLIDVQPDQGQPLDQPAPINIIQSPYSEPAPITDDQRFRTLLEEIQPLIVKAGFTKFSVTVDYNQPNSFGSSFGGVETIDDIAGLLANAVKTAHEYSHFLGTQTHG